jgi:hypothetical protein
MPTRIQRKRTKGWRMPPNTMAVGRPGYFGSPFTGPRAAADYRRWMAGKMGREEFARKNTRAFVHHFDRQNVLREVVRLRGKNLACWCALDQPCHADVLLELANSPPVGSGSEPA